MLLFMAFSVVDTLRRFETHLTTIGSSLNGEMHPFVLKVELATIARIRRSGENDMRLIPGKGKEMGNEYRSDYLDLSNSEASFVSVCKTDMTLGQAWERFYDDFMMGVKGTEPGLIQKEVSEFIKICVQYMTVFNGISIDDAIESIRKLGEQKRAEYTVLRDGCGQKFYVPEPEFEERFATYMKKQMIGRVTRRTLRFNAFKLGLDGV